MRSLAPLCVGLLSCVGNLEGPRPSSPVAATIEAPTSAIPRLSRREIETSIVSVFGQSGAALRNLPADPPTAVNPTTLAEDEVFDTLAAIKQPNQVFVEGLENLAFEVARDFAATPAAVQAVAGCAPMGMALDEGCLSQLINQVSLRLWRRPITDDERDALLSLVRPLASGQAQPHTVAVRAAVAALVQSPEFVYRVEVGTPVSEGVARLDDLELVSRLAAFLWGAAPTADLLNSVLTNPLDDAALEALVDAMLDDARAQQQMRAFHQLWLRYPDLLISDALLAADMRAESDALIDRALFTPGTPWTSLFTSTQTFVTPRLATHYGLPNVPSAPGWVNVDAPRAGLLSHGSFLSLSSTRMTDTLPSRRGAILARRLLCLTILPPPKDVNIDNGVPVEPGACKREAYQAHAGGSCVGCHAVIDGLGFGFEQLDGQGRLRQVEPNNASCTISAEGRFVGRPFSGARDLVTQFESNLSHCAIAQLSRFAFRDRTVAPEALARFEAAFTSSGSDFRQLMRGIALDPRFRTRVDEGPEVSP